MKVTSLFVVLLLLQNVAPPPRPGSVSGRVVDSGTGQPLAGVTVQLRGTGASALLIAGDTRGDGTFELRNIPPGIYRIEAFRSGYILALYGDVKNAAPTHTIAPGQSLSGISIMLTPGSVIYGRLVDERGEAIVSATVEALKTAYKDGQRDRRLAQAAITNDLGEYRLFMLAAGKYAVRVTPPTLEFETLPFARPEVIPVYFPGTIEPNEARDIDLHAGEILGGINFLSFPTRTRRITGSVSLADGNSARAVLSPRNGSAGIEQSVDSATGAFEFKNVVPGAYTLVAKSSSQRGILSLDVANADVLNLRVPMSSGIQIPVHVHIDGHGAGDDPELEKLYFVARRDQPITGLEVDVYSPFPDGRFTFDLLPADYRLHLEPEDFYIKSLTLGDIDVLNQGLHVSSSPGVLLKIVVGGNPGSVQGRTEQDVGTVVLVPDVSRRSQRMLYKSAKIGSSREFHFAKVAPGDYKLFAWREENGGPWLDSDYLSRYESRGIPIHVEAGRITVSERSIPLLD